MGQAAGGLLVIDEGRLGSARCGLGISGSLQDRYSMRVGRVRFSDLEVVERKGK